MMIQHKEYEPIVTAQECWQKGMVLRDTDWLCYELNSQGPCGLSQRIVYTRRCQLNKIYSE